MTVVVRENEDYNGVIQTIHRTFHWRNQRSVKSIRIRQRWIKYIQRITDWKRRKKLIFFDSKIIFSSIRLRTCLSDWNKHKFKSISLSMQTQIKRLIFIQSKKSVSRKFRIFFLNNKPLINKLLIWVKNWEILLHSLINPELIFSITTWAKLCRI